MQVRRLMCVCLTRFYTHGDIISIYARVSSLQSALNGKDPAVHTKPLAEVRCPRDRKAPSTSAVAVDTMLCFAVRAARRQHGPA